MRIGIIGCAGRMGRTLISEILASEGLQMSGGLERPGSEYVGVDLGQLAAVDNIGITASDDLETFVSEADAIIDFTSPSSTIACAEAVSRMGKIHIIGTTGLSEEHKEKLREYAKKAVIVLSPNMSVGVNILLALTEKAAAILNDSYDIEIVEMHHNKKVDAPSGTALALGTAAADGRNVNLNDVAKKSRDGQIGPREKGEIGFATLRGGDVVGDHTVMFAGPGERIELTHKASSRTIFAHGALMAAKWAKGKKHGLYSMKDVLGLK